MNYYLQITTEFHSHLHINEEYLTHSVLKIRRYICSCIRVERWIFFISAARETYYSISDMLPSIP